eukprot:TRINITY_DN30472_c0_g1_i2.p1 TRINITY_DN30472_c0_g1~~TRINITY_DN30472_c0_g1_i2.p1  ORF type:complete len:378 (-),score=46.76 TRINITY_DN30472_c0_g1_i2:89-1222(-)
MHVFGQRKPAIYDDDDDLPAGWGDGEDEDDDDVGFATAPRTFTNGAPVQAASAIAQNTEASTVRPVGADFVPDVPGDATSRGTPTAASVHPRSASVPPKPSAPIAVPPASRGRPPAAGTRRELPLLFTNVSTGATGASASAKPPLPPQRNRLRWLVVPTSTSATLSAPTKALVPLSRPAVSWRSSSYGSARMCPARRHSSSWRTFSDGCRRWRKPTPRRLLWKTTSAAIQEERRVPLTAACGAYAAQSEAMQAQAVALLDRRHQRRRQHYRLLAAPTEASRVRPLFPSRGLLRATALPPLGAPVVPTRGGSVPARAAGRRRPPGTAAAACRILCPRVVSDASRPRRPQLVPRASAALVIAAWEHCLGWLARSTPRSC